MSYSLFGSAAKYLVVQYGTNEDIAEDFGGESDGDPHQVSLVLNDGGNQHAFVIEGTHDELLDLGCRIVAAASSIHRQAKVDYGPQVTADDFLTGAEQLHEAHVAGGLNLNAPDFAGVRAIVLALRGSVEEQA